MVKPGEISGRVALVTGAGRGIGREIALALASEGARVAAVSRSLNDLEQLALASEDYVFPCAADVSQDAEVDGAFAKVRSQLGPVTILVAAAGVARFGNTLDLTHEDWHEQIATNLTGMFLTNAAALKDMVESGGDIVNVLSMSSTIALPGSAAYTASKYGALGLTRALSAEYRSRGIRISAVLPGATGTSLWDYAGSNLDRSRMMTPQDVADAVMWALERPASAHVDEIRIMPPDGVL